MCFFPSILLKLKTDSPYQPASYRDFFHEQYQITVVSEKVGERWWFQISKTSLLELPPTQQQSPPGLVGNPYKPSFVIICDCYLVGGRPNPFIVYYTHMFDISIYSVGTVVMISHQDFQMSNLLTCFTPLGPTCHHPKAPKPSTPPHSEPPRQRSPARPGEWFAACSIFRPSRSTVGSFEAEKKFWLEDHPSYPPWN